MKLHEDNCLDEFELIKKMNIGEYKFLLYGCQGCGKQYLEPDGWYIEI